MFEIENEERFNGLKYTIIFIVLAYIFSIGVRMIWVYQFKDFTPFVWDGELMINTNDGYYFASAVQHILNGLHAHNPQIPVAIRTYPGVIYSSVVLAKLLPFSFETIMLYMPAFVSSLVVVPIILIARLFKMQIFGFLSALLGSIAWSYYNRTMVGYYDSDMFSVLLQMFVLYGFISLLVEHKFSNIILSFIAISAYPYFYPQGMSLIYGMYGLYIIYTLIAYRDDKISYVGIAVVAIALIPLPYILKVLLALLILALYRLDKLEKKHWIYIAIFAFSSFMIFANVFSLIFEKLIGYTHRGTEAEGLHFFQVIQTVQEAGKISFSTMAHRISGSDAGVIVALLGYIFLVLKHRQFLIALPLIAIGIFSLLGGLRFTVYAVAIAAMGSVYLFYVLTHTIRQKGLRYALISIMTLAMIYPNITHIISYKVPTVFSAHEVKVLDHLKNQGSDKDYIISWWDYGYPLWYYTNKNTLIDGGKHHHDNFIVSRILTTPSQLEAAQLSRLAVNTYVDSNYSTVADTLFKNRQTDQVNVEEFLSQLSMERLPLRKKGREVYLYLPFKMFAIFQTVALFSNLDLNSGQKGMRPFYYQTVNYKDTGRKLYLGGNIYLDKVTGKVHLGSNEIGLKAFYTVAYDKTGNIHTQKRFISTNGRVSLIYLRSYRRMLLVDDFYLYSTFFQLFIFENYDKELFEAVELTPYAKVYKVKI